MSGVSDSTGAPGLALPRAHERKLLRHARRAARRARRSGRPVLAAVTVPISPLIDPAAVLAAARRDGEPWNVLEQPARDGAVVCALGSVLRLSAEGPSRFTSLAEQWREVLAGASFEGPAGAVPGAGPIAFGGLAFADGGAATTEWDGFGAGTLDVPEVAITRRAGAARLTVAVGVGPEDDHEELVAALSARIAALDPGARLPSIAGDVGRHRVQSAMPPEHYIEAVRSAVGRIRAGAFEKIVLARAVDVEAPTPYDPAAILGLLREGFPECHLTVCCRGDAAFIAASPELLIRREGMRASTLALAGSARRSADPSVDAHLGEQLLRSEKDRGEHEVVVRRIVRTLEPAAVWVTAADQPEIARIANIQHLATPIRAQLQRPVGALELAGLLHPTPAVGGEPAASALPVIPALEGLDRGWYAGPVGWVDAAEDGEFIVGLRSALIRGTRARCYAGVGVVAGSDPDSELAETETKLGALLPALTL